MTVATGDGFTVSDVRCRARHSGASSPEEQLGHVSWRYGPECSAGAPAMARCSSTRRPPTSRVRGSRKASPTRSTEVTCARRFVSSRLCWRRSWAVILLSRCPPFHFVRATTSPSDGSLQLARSGSDTAGSLAEQLLAFAATVLARRLPSRLGSGRPATVAVRRQIVDHARMALHDNPTFGAGGAQPDGPMLAAPPEQDRSVCDRHICELLPQQAAACSSARQD